MGLAASQCRLLFITSRQTDVSYKMQRLSNSLLTLARDDEDIATEYNRRLNATKLDTDLSYADIMGNPINYATFNYVTEANSGKVVLSSALAKKYKLDGSNAKLPSTASEFIKNVTGINATDKQIDAIGSASTGSLSGNGSSAGSSSKTLADLLGNKTGNNNVYNNRNQFFVSDLSDKYYTLPSGYKVLDDTGENAFLGKAMNNNVITELNGDYLNGFFAVQGTYRPGESGNCPDLAMHFQNKSLSDLYNSTGYSGTMLLGNILVDDNNKSTFDWSQIEGNFGAFASNISTMVSNSLISAKLGIADDKIRQYVDNKTNEIKDSYMANRVPSDNDMLLAKAYNEKLMDLDFNGDDNYRNAKEQDFKTDRDYVTTGKDEDGNPITVTIPKDSLITFSNIQESDTGDVEAYCRTPNNETYTIYISREPDFHNVYKDNNYNDLEFSQNEYAISASTYMSQGAHGLVAAFASDSNGSEAGKAWSVSIDAGQFVRDLMDGIMAELAGDTYKPTGSSKNNVNVYTLDLSKITNPESSESTSTRPAQPTPRTDSTTDSSSVDISGFTEHDKELIRYYNAAYKTLKENGFTISDNVLDKDKFTAGLYNGVYYVNGKNVNDQVTPQKDEETIKTAEAWYNAETKKIKRKEKEIEMQQTQLQSEYTALNTEIESVKSIISENIKRSFQYCNA